MTNLSTTSPQDTPTAARTVFTTRKGPVQVGQHYMDRHRQNNARILRVDRIGEPYTYLRKYRCQIDCVVVEQYNDARGRTTPDRPTEIEATNLRTHYVLIAEPGQQVPGIVTLLGKDQ
ncbi:MULTISPECIES: hypothetical protein [unclassified Nocardia]|uniref:hypothetical protein n=1 Tax=unclassified Nocardia TaxID=2637762 RepID=UPI001CE40935|nr:MULTISPECIES: hypothetical protein [unclassified Nocardia]